MNFYSRTERTSRSDGAEISIVRYYKCPVCGRTIVDEELLVKQTSEGLKITVKHNGLKKTAIIREVPSSG